MALAVGACGDDEPESTSAETVGEPVAEAPETVAEEEAELPVASDPCDTLTEAMVRSTFELPADTAIALNPSDLPVRALCAYSWQKPRAEDEARVSLHFASAFFTAEAARTGFDSLMESIERGLSPQAQAPTGDEEGTTEASTREVEGVGDAARWAPALKQLVVLDGSRILHIHVELEPEAEDNLAHAKRLAAAILGG